MPLPLSTVTATGRGVPRRHPRDSSVRPAQPLGDGQSYVSRGLGARAMRWTSPRAMASPRCMPSWLSWLLFIIFILVFIVPNPVEAGVFFGDLINSIVVFFRSMGAAVGV
jgi:hypothetical protein